jgi:hypothetical protein
MFRLCNPQEFNMKSSNCRFLPMASSLILLALCLATPASASPEANDSCNAIIAACKSAGFKQGGKDGDGLWHDCVQPLLQKKPGASRLPLPAINPGSAEACLKAHPSYGTP